MKKLILVALLGLSSSMAFADIQVFENSSNDQQSYSCRFRSGKGSMYCQVRTSFEDKQGTKPTDPAMTEENNRSVASLRVECNDGFDLFDRDARLRKDDESIKIIGKSSDHESGRSKDQQEATLRLLKDSREGDRRDNEIRARLEIQSGGVWTNMRGSCEKRENGRDNLTAELN